MKKVLLYSLVFLSLTCHKQPAPAQLSAYYWKTRFSLSAPQQEFLSEYDVQKLYIRYCDIILLEGEAVPDAPVATGRKAQWVYRANQSLLQPDGQAGTIGL